MGYNASRLGHLVGPFTTAAAVQSGGAGTGAGEITTPRIDGFVVGIYVQYVGSPPSGTTDVTIKTEGTAPAPPTYNILVLTDAATDGWFFPQIQICNTAGSAISGEYTPIPVADTINIAMAGANTGDQAKVWLLMG